jgi:hypothetical protein
MRLAIVVLGIAISLAPRFAHAMCGSPEPELFPAGGIVPRDPTLALFVPARQTGGKLAVTGATLETTEVSRTSAFVVYRIRTTQTAGAFELTYQPPAEDNWIPDPITARYVVGSVPANAARVTGVEHVYGAWTCSHTDAIRFRIEGNAIAYRLAWHSQEPATVIDPSRAKVGYLSCIGMNVDIDLASLQAFDLVALFADGSERVLGSSAMSNTDKKIRLPLELVGEDAEDIGTTDKPPLERGRRVVDAEPCSLVGHGLLAVLALLACVLARFAVGIAMTERVPNRPRA